MTSIRIILAAALCLSLASARGAEIEEIVVTAEKREGTLQETPIAVTAVTRDDIELRNLDDFAQIQFVAPALVFAEIADMAQITMRGVGVDISTMDAEPGVAVYSDGTYRGGITSSASLFAAAMHIWVASSTCRKSCEREPSPASPMTPVSRAESTIRGSSAARRMPRP